MIFDTQNIFLHFFWLQSENYAWFLNLRMSEKFFLLQNDNYAWFLNKNSIKIFFQVLDVTYHDKLLEICFEYRFLFPIMLDRSEPCRGRFSIFEKKVQFFPLKGKKLTPSHFVQKLAQIVGYGQTVIGIV